MKNKIVKILLVSASLVAGLTILRFLYEWFRPGTVDTVNYSDNDLYLQNEVSSIKRNYASFKLKSLDPSPQQPMGSSEQKYEKVAALSSHSDDFDKDNQSLRLKISNFQAVIQYEKNSGLKPNRSLYLQVGVFPQLFDRFLEEVRSIGHLSSIQIDKTDQTSEYKKLTAKKLSLENTRRSLMSLKNRGGSIEELMKLEEKLQSIEQEIQDLGVNLGDFSSENEFCTVRFTLSEQRLVLKNPFKILISAFLWSLRFLAAAAGLILLFSLAGLAVLGLLSKLKGMPEWLTKKLDQKA